MPGMAVRETCLQRAERTCAEAAEAGAQDVSIQQAELTAAAAALPSAADVAAACQFMRLPIRFDSLQAEVNAMALFHLLDFGSGFDSLLLVKTGKDARETVQFGLLGMLMHGAPLESHHWMREFSAYQIFQFFSIDVSEDEAVPGLPGVVLSRPGPLAGFTNKLREALNETGAMLGDSAHASLGALILANLDAQLAGGEQAPSAAALVEELAETFPGFNDAGLYRGRQVYFYRKAQLLAAQLHLRFRGTDARFKFSDMQALTIDSGNVLPAVLRQQGVLRLSDGLAAAVDAGTDLQGDERERALRAATVVAGRRMCEEAAAAEAAAAAGGADAEEEPASAAIQPWQLSMYLVLKEEEVRRQRAEGAAAAAAATETAPVPAPKRHVAKGSVAY